MKVKELIEILSKLDQEKEMFTAYEVDAYPLDNDPIGVVYKIIRTYKGDYSKLSPVISNVIESGMKYKMRETEWYKTENAGEIGYYIG